MKETCFVILWFHLISSIVWTLYLQHGLFSGEDTQEENSVQNISVNESMSIGNSLRGVAANLVLPPPPPSYFLGYTLPPGHPCNSFTLPPPPADKKRTGPRREF